MSIKNHVYRCEQCGLMVEVIDGTQAKLVCCDGPMKHMTENTADASKEKHLPVCTRDGNRLHVKIGSVLHPMTPEHLIEWLELIQEGRYIRVTFRPGQVPEAHLPVAPAAATVRAYCNLHGLWKTEVPQA